MLKSAATTIALLILLVAWGWFNSEIDPVSWKPDANPGFTAGFEPNGRLDPVELLPAVGTGPEDTAISSDGFIYTGIESGEIFRVDPDTGESSLFANTGGRPLGMVFDGNGNLIVADAGQGLLEIDQTGQIKILVGTDKVGFADDVDIAADGTIWFSNASQNYSYGNSLNSFLEGDLSGQVFSYKPHNGELKLQIQGLFLANGVAIGPDD